MLAAILVAGCGDGPPSKDGGDVAPDEDAALPHLPGAPRLDYAFTVGDFGGCVFASPIVVQSQGEEFVMVLSEDGRISAVDPQSGDVTWSLTLPAPAGQAPNLLATPVAAHGRLFIAYQHQERVTGARTSAHVRVVDLERRAFDAEMLEVELRATLPTYDGGLVTFDPLTQAVRGTLVHTDTVDTELGILYVANGGPSTTQPWHGWVFELDLDAWLREGTAAAIVNALVTTAENDCGPPESHDGNRCGGGVWAPSGPKLFETAEGGYDLLISTGNGRLDLDRSAYAFTLMRTERGLAFEHGCDPALCRDFDAANPALACIESCTNLFIQRRFPGDPPLAPAGGECAGLTYYECLARMDYDTGSSSPARVELADGPTVYVQPAKEGTAYLIDAARMGRVYDREILVDVCGTPDDPCKVFWAGMVVTEPVIASVDGDPLAIISTFESDATHPAGLVALKIVMDGAEPRFQRLWEAPSFDTGAAIAQFRHHPSRGTLTEHLGEAYVWVVDVNGVDADIGLIFGVRVRDGLIVERKPMRSSGQRYVEPLWQGDRLFVPSCDSNEGPGRVEVYDLALQQSP